MRWSLRSSEEWKRHFAWLPVYIDGMMVWLEIYESRVNADNVNWAAGSFTELRLPPI